MLGCDGIGIDGLPLPATPPVTQSDIHVVEAAIRELVKVIATQAERIVRLEDYIEALERKLDG